MAKYNLEAMRIQIANSRTGPAITIESLDLSRSDITKQPQTVVEKIRNCSCVGLLDGKKVPLFAPGATKYFYWEAISGYEACPLMTPINSLFKAQGHHFTGTLFDNSYDVCWRSPRRRWMEGMLVPVEVVVTSSLDITARECDCEWCNMAGSYDWKYHYSNVVFLPQKLADRMTYIMLEHLP